MNKDIHQQLLSVGAAQWLLGREQFLRDPASQLHAEFYERVPDQTLSEHMQYPPPGPVTWQRPLGLTLDREKLWQRVSKRPVLISLAISDDARLGTCGS